MQNKRKGARWLDIQGERWQYFVGKKFVEVRSPVNKVTLVPRHTLDVTVDVTCGSDRGCGSRGCDHVIDSVEVTLPGKVAQYIRRNLAA